MNYLRIPSTTAADELAGMLSGDEIPIDAPREHLHAVLLRLCEIVADQAAEIGDLRSRLPRLKVAGYRADGFPVIERAGEPEGGAA